MMPPAAICGSPVTAATSPISDSTPWSRPGSSSFTNVPRCAPASYPCTQSASTPAAAAISASAGVVTVTTTALPPSCRALITPAAGQPKVKLVTAGGSASRAAIFPSKLSSSQLASPRAGPSESRYLASLPPSGYGAPGTKTLTPNGSAVAARTSLISAVIAAGVL